MNNQYKPELTLEHLRAWAASQPEVEEVKDPNEGMVTPQKMTALVEHIIDGIQDYVDTSVDRATETDGLEGFSYHDEGWINTIEITDILTTILQSVGTERIVEHLLSRQ